MRLPTASGSVTIVDGVDYDVEPGQVFGVAGESGSGKTISVLALLRLLPDGARGRRERAVFGGRDLLALRRRALRDVRGREIAMVFQDPLTSLHPMLSHRPAADRARALPRGPRRARRPSAARSSCSTQVRIPDPERRAQRVPAPVLRRHAAAHRDRDRPRLPAQAADRRRADDRARRHRAGGHPAAARPLRRETGLSVILITHDLGVMSSIADSVSVFYAGRIVESGATRDVLGTPRHPYTRALLDALPHPEGAAERAAGRDRRVASDAARRGRAGCAFHPRCAYAKPSCSEHVPELVAIGGGRTLACPIDPLAGP